MISLKYLTAATTLAIGALSFSAADAASVKNIVLVHGAFADASTFRSLTEILVKDGYHVSLVQEPITSLEDDVAATNRVLELQTGPVLLVSHSYGGMVITEAGNAANVAGLVYVASFQPDAGENLVGLSAKMPVASKAIGPTKDGKYLFIDPKAFPEDFAGDRPKAEAQFLANAQVMGSVAAFTAKVTDPAWKAKKSWAIVATEDRSINPDLERFMAKRAGSEVTEIKASHMVFESQAKKVAAVIEKAAKALSN